MGPGVLCARKRLLSSGVREGGQASGYEKPKSVLPRQNFVIGNRFIDLFLGEQEFANPDT